MRKSVMDHLEFLIIYFSLESNYPPSAAIYEEFFFFFTTIKENIPPNNSQSPIVGFQKCLQSA